MFPRFLPLLPLLAAAITARGAITVSNVADKTKYDAPRSFTVNADPNAATTTATLNGVPVPVGVAVNVTAIGFQELRAESRDAGGALVDTENVRFITRNAEREGSEDGLPSHTPFRSVNDAPSAFAGGTLKVIAPAVWPTGFPIPLAAKLLTGANETLRLNGVVTFAGFPATTLQLRRGWGSVQVPAAVAAGTVNVSALVNGLAHNPVIAIEAMTFTDVSGTISSNTTWPANSRMRVTSRLTISAGATLTIGAGSIVLLDTGTATNGSAAEISVSGTLQVNGTDANPVVFAPATPGGNWGGIELPAATSLVNAAWTIFTGAGEDDDWFDNNPGLGGSTHQSEQPTFAIVGSGSGTSIGARLHLADCFSFDHAGQQMNSKTNTWIDLQRVLFQRCITSGELNGSKVTIDRSALIEFPSETPNFVNDDNDALYLTNGDHSITNTILGFSKDDGVDSGANGGNSPFGTVNPLTGNTVTRFDQVNNWYEGTTHEGNSLSGTRNVYYTGCVFLNCGQGVEAGYSSAAGADGPNAFIDGCLFVGNMVGVRVGDNYGSGYNYNSTADVKNSLILNNAYQDVWSYNWHPTAAYGWIYQDATTTNTLGRPWFKVENNALTKTDAAHHPLNDLWNPANPLHAAKLATFMPVPGSNVGVAISSYEPAQQATAAYPGAFTVRLSTFSSNAVSVNWSVVGKLDPFSDAQVLLAGGTLAFAPGETLKTISAPVASPANYALIHVALTDPVNAEVTGDAWYIQPPTPDPNLVARGSTGWRYRETRSEPPATWKELAFDDSSPAATEWLACTLPAGFGVSGVMFGTTVNGGSSSDRTRAFYFRKKFTVADPAQITALTFRIRRDDAAAVWLNNDATPTVVSADGTFNAPYTYAMTGTANAVSNSNNTGTYLSYAIPPSKLVAGENILSIEVHQTSLTSSDILLDCELIATYDPPFELHLTEAGGDPAIYWFDSAATLERATDLELGDWQTVPGAQSPVRLDLSQPQEFYRLRE